MPSSLGPLAFVQAWQEAANRGDREQLLRLSDPDIEIVGPRGSGHGTALLQEWLSRAGLHLTTLRTFLQGNTVVVAQHGVWHSRETGAVTGERDVASAFRVANEHIVAFARYDSLGDALTATGLTLADEVAEAAQKGTADGTAGPHPRNTDPV